MCASLYYPVEFNYICYEASSGGLSVPESDQRISYYGISAFPTLKWDGYQTVEGAGSGAVDGSQYIPIIENHLLNTTPVEVRIADHSFTPGSSFVDVAVRLHGELATIANTKIRVALVENNITYSGHDYYDRILRDMYPDAAGTALTIQHDGQEQTLHLPFALDGGWDPTDLLLIAWVQRDSDKFIYNSTSSDVAPYLASAEVAGAQQIVTDGQTPAVFGNATLRNIGLEPDTYDIVLDGSQLPAGWTAFFTHEGVDGTSATVSLDPFETANFVVTIDPSSNTSGGVTVNVTSHALGEVVTSLRFVAVSTSTDVLLVADDGAADLAAYYGAALTGANRTYSVWDRQLSAVNADLFSHFDAVVWYCGDATPGLEAADREALDTYLFAGGTLLLSGQDVANDLQSQGGSANAWFQFRTRCGFVNGNSGSFTVNGVAGDPVGDGLSFAITGGDGAGNQTDPDVIQCLTGEAVPAFRYATNTVAGVRVEYNGYKIVFLGFGLEGIATAAARADVMDAAMTWLIGPAGPTPVPGDTPAVLSLAQNTPNPFNPQTRIAFSLAQPGPVQLAVYDLQGRLVRTLASETMTAGEHVMLWDGRTDGGHDAASGTYVYRLTSDGTTLSHKMTLLK